MTPDPKYLAKLWRGQLGRCEGAGRLPYSNTTEGALRSLDLRERTGKSAPVIEVARMMKRDATLRPNKSRPHWLQNHTGER